MKTCKVAGMMLAVVLAIAPAAFGGGFGDVNLPDGRFHEGGNASNSEVKGTHRSLSTSFYALSDQSDARHRYVAPSWWGDPFGLAVFNKE